MHNTLVVASAIVEPCFGDDASTVVASFIAIAASFFTTEAFAAISFAFAAVRKLT